MEKTHRIAQIYGYLVCLVAIITFLIAIADLVTSLIDLGDPLHSEWTQRGEPSLASFNNYKMDIMKSPQKEGGTTVSGFIPDDNTLRSMYQAAKADKIQSAKHRTNRSMIVDSLLIVLCAALFIIHWKWMRKLVKTEA